MEPALFLFVMVNTFAIKACFGKSIYLFLVVSGLKIPIYGPNGYFITFYRFILDLPCRLRRSNHPPA
jgi:hypothetical protein